jgi:arsenate reductase (thioredoxin)
MHEGCGPNSRNLRYAWVCQQGMTAMAERVFTVLFLSQRGSGRAVMAAAMLNHIGKGKFHAMSAGVRPGERYDPTALELLEHAHVPRPEGTPQHFRKFAAEGAPPLDFVFTLSDTAAGEPPPVWPGLPVTGHWSCSDPEKEPEDSASRRLSLISTRAQLERRLRVFMNLPFASLDRLSLQSHVDELGASEEKDHDDPSGTEGSRKPADEPPPRPAPVAPTTPPPPD